MGRAQDHRWPRAPLNPTRHGSLPTPKRQMCAHLTNARRSTQRTRVANQNATMPNNSLSVLSTVAHLGLRVKGAGVHGELELPDLLLDGLHLRAHVAVNAN